MNVPGSIQPQQDAQNPAPIEAPPEGFHPDAIQQTPLSNVKTPDELVAAEPDDGPSRWDVLTAKLKLAAIDSPTATLARQFSEPTGPSQFGMAKGGDVPDYQTPAKPKLSPDEANKLYPGMPKPFDEPIDPDSAGRIAAVQKRRQDLQDIIAQGPVLGKGIDALVGATAGAAAGSLGGLPGMVGGAVAGAAFGAYGGGESVVVGALDPLNIALMAATGGLAKPIGVLGQNLVINATSAGLSAPQRIKERQDVNLKDEAINVVGGAVGGTALHVLMGLATGRYSQAQRFARQADPGMQQKMLETAIAQHEAGANVDMGPATFEMQRRASGETEGATPTYEFKPVDHPSERTYYAARGAETNLPVEFQDFGEGVHAVDNGQVANNLVSAPESQFTGSVHEVNIDPSAKILDLEEPLPKALADQASAELEKVGLGEGLLPKEQLSGMPARDVMEMLKGVDTGPGEPSPLEVMKARVQAEGYDGYKYVSDMNGIQHNGVVVFDPKKVALGEEFKANKDTTPRMSPEEAQTSAKSVDDPQNSRNYETGADAKIAEMQSMKPGATDLNEEDARIKEQTQNALSRLKQAAIEDPSLLEDPEYKALLHDETQTKQEAQVMKDFADCIVGDST